MPQYTDSVKHTATVARFAAAVALEKIKHIAAQLAHAPADGRLHRTLSAAIRIEAVAYRKALDVEQATATHDRKQMLRIEPQASSRTSLPRHKVVAPSDRIRSPRSMSRRRRPEISPGPWLFIRDEDSIWIERSYGFCMDVAGPGTARAHLDFPNENAVQAFRAATAERLTRGGWFRSKFDHDRRTQSERRRGPRATVNRRLPVVEARPW
jgi:hypothetical protein